MTLSFSRPAAVVAAALLLGCAGCDRTTRGNPGKDDRHRAQTTQEGGSTSVTGDAGKSENFGDTRAKKESSGVSPSQSPTGLSKDAAAGQSAPVTPQAPAERATPKK